MQRVTHKQIGKVDINIKKNVYNIGDLENFVKGLCHIRDYMSCDLCQNSV